MSKSFSSLVPTTSRARNSQSDQDAEICKTSVSKLFDLPVEIRDKIFAHLLDAKLVHFWARSQYFPSGTSESYALLRSPWDFDTNILRTNRFLYRETSNVLYKTNLFTRVALYSTVVDFAEILLQEIAANVTFIGAELSKIDMCKQHAMETKIFIRSGTVKRAQFLIPYTSLASLVSFLSTLCNGPKSDQSPLSGIEIDVRNTYSIADEAICQTLLEPWRKIFNVTHSLVSWPSGPQEFLQSLQADMSKQAFDTQAWLKSITNVKANGLRAFENGLLESSIQFFEQALMSIKNAYKDIPGSRRNDMLAMEEEYSKAVAKIRFESQMGISMAWVNLEDRFESARKSAMNAYHISCNTRGPDWPSPLDDPPNNEDWFLDSDRAAALFCYGSAAMALGEFRDARDNFEEAQRLNPIDPGISRAVIQAQQRAREQLRSP